jgi:hypothetical protein
MENIHLTYKNRFEKGPPLCIFGLGDARSSVAETGYNITVCHERNVLSQYKVGLISYHDKPVIKDFWGQGLIIPQMTKISMMSWRSPSTTVSLKKIFSRPVSKILLYACFMMVCNNLIKPLRSS